MAIRLVDTERRRQGWYLSLSGEYQDLWDYICETCDNAGVWKTDLKTDFETTKKFRVSLDQFFEKVTSSKTDGGFERIVRLKNGRWFLPNFIKFQWFGNKTFDLNCSSGRNKGIYNSLILNAVPLKYVCGINEVNLTSNGGHSHSHSQDKGFGKSENLFQNWDLEKKNFSNDFKWKEKFTHDKKISMHQLEGKMKEFVSDLDLREDYKDVKELRNHFTNWYNKNLKTSAYQQPERSTAPPLKN